MSKQVLSIEQMRRLYELELDTSQASMEYIEDNNGKILCISKENKHNIKDIEDGFIICEALTLQDILDILPKVIIKDNVENYIGIFRGRHRYTYFFTGNLIYQFENSECIDAAYEMLCLCIENGYMGTCCS